MILVFGAVLKELYAKWFLNGFIKSGMEVLRIQERHLWLISILDVMPKDRYTFMKRDKREKIVKCLLFSVKSMRDVLKGVCWGWWRLNKPFWLWVLLVRWRLRRLYSKSSDVLDRASSSWISISVKFHLNSRLRFWEFWQVMNN
jgi:hypothetical protein